MYGKIFASMYEGTLYGQWEAIVTFQQMITLCDSEGVVDMTPQALSARTSIPLEIISKGIEILEAPDPDSRTEGNEGRRIAKIDNHRNWGWAIINHRKYKMMAKYEEKREADRVRIATKRATAKDVAGSRKKSQDVESVANVAHTNTNTHTNTNKKKTIGPYGSDFESAWTKFPKRSGNNPKRKAFTAWSARLKEHEKPEKITAGVERYAAYIEEIGNTNTQFVMQAATFFGPDRPYEQTWELPKIKGTADDWWKSNEGVDKKARELGMTPGGNESYQELKGRIASEIRRRRTNAEEGK